MVSTVILTKNAELYIERCIKSVLWSDEILIIDDNSEDQTSAIAKKLGVSIISHALSNNFAQQRNFALERVKGDWVFFLDSDEVVSETLKEEIQQVVLDTNRRDLTGFYIQRRDIMWGKKIYHGENGSIMLLRLGRKGFGKWEGRVHEQWHIKGRVGQLENVLYHYPHPHITEFLEEINWYTTLRAEELYQKGIRVEWFDILLYPKVKFIQNYFLRLGFLDGTAGMILALLMSLHSFLVRGKIWQLQNKR